MIVRLTTEGGGRGESRLVRHVRFERSEETVSDAHRSADAGRDARLADGAERGRVPVGVLVCCEDPRDSEATCRAVERDLRRESWTGAGDGWHCRVCAADSGGSAPRGRDGSGRWLWGFDLILTLEVDHG